MEKKEPLWDARLSLPDDHPFRYCAPEPTPEIPATAVGRLNLLTAAEIEAERKAKKQAAK
jgi:hypothetical protein